MASDKFQNVTGELNNLVAPTGAFAVTYTDGQFDSALVDLLTQLVGDGLSITGAKVASDTTANPETWSVTGTDNVPGCWRVCAMAWSMASLSLPCTCTAPFTTTCGV